MKGHWSRILVITLCVLLLTACTSNKEAAEQGKQANIVRVTEVQKQALHNEYVYSGALQPMEQVAVTFQAAGEIKQTLAEVGDVVQVGDVLAVLDSEYAQLQLDQARSGVNQAQAMIEAASAGIEASDAQIRAAQAELATAKKGASEQQIAQAKNGVAQAEAAYNKVKADAERYKLLYDQGAVSQSDYEGIQLQLDNAEKTLANAKESLSQVLEGATEEQIKAVTAMVHQAEAGKQSSLASLTQAQAGYANALTVQEQAALALSKTSVTATISGSILEKFATAGQMTAAGSPAYSVGVIDQMKVLLPIPDYMTNHWNVGQEVQVKLYDEVRVGKVNRVSPQTNFGSGTVSVEVVVPNEKHDWKAGQIVTAKIEIEQESGFLIPVESVVSYGEQPHVFCNVNGIAVKKDVVLGKNIVENQFHVIEGLQEGDKVIVTGVNKLFDGDLIQVMEAQPHD